MYVTGPKLHDIVSSIERYFNLNRKGDSVDKTNI